MQREDLKHYLLWRKIFSRQRFTKHLQSRCRVHNFAMHMITTESCSPALFLQMAQADPRSQQQRHPSEHQNQRGKQLRVISLLEEPARNRGTCRHLFLDHVSRRQELSAFSLMSMPHIWQQLIPLASENRALGIWCKFASYTLSSPHLAWSLFPPAIWLLRHLARVYWD